MKYKKKLLPVAVFELITGGALQKIGEFNNQAEASAAAGISGKTQKKRAHGIPCGMLPAHETHKVAFQGHSLFFRWILLLHLHVPTWVCHHRGRHQSEARPPRSSRSPEGAEGLAPQSSWCV
jgi:hypothetical protein